MACSSVFQAFLTSSNILFIQICLVASSLVDWEKKWSTLYQIRRMCVVLFGQREVRSGSAAIPKVPVYVLNLKFAAFVLHCCTVKLIYIWV